MDSWRLSIDSMPRYRRDGVWRCRRRSCGGGGRSCGHLQRSRARRWAVGGKVHIVQLSCKVLGLDGGAALAVRSKVVLAHRRQGKLAFRIGRLHTLHKQT